MSVHDKTYANQLQHLVSEGIKSENRTGVDTYKDFGDMRKYNLFDHGFPLITSKLTSLKMILTENRWLYRGGTNVLELQKEDCKIWNEWANKAGYLGPVYGKLMREWEDIRIVDPSTLEGARQVTFLISKGYVKMGDLVKTISTIPIFEREMVAGNVEQQYIDQILESSFNHGVYSDDKNPEVDEVENCSVIQINEKERVYFHDDGITELVHIMAEAMNLDYDDLNKTKSVYIKKVDQLTNKVDDLIRNPNDRRLLISMYNPALAPYEERDLDLTERYESYLWQEIEKLEADEKWMDEAIRRHDAGDAPPTIQARDFAESEIGRASCRERVCMFV